MSDYAVANQAVTPRGLRDTATPLQRGPGMLEEQIDAYRMLHDHVANLIQRTGNIADRIFGAHPEPVEAQKNLAGSSTLVNQLADGRERIARALEYLSKQISRLEEL